MKSGIRSIGDRAYATVIPASSLAYQGVSWRRRQRNSAGMSVLSRAALSLSPTAGHSLTAGGACTLAAKPSSLSEASITMVLSGIGSPAITVFAIRVSMTD